MSYCQIVRSEPKKLPANGLFVTCIQGTTYIFLKTIKDGRFIEGKVIDKNDFDIGKCSEPIFIDYNAAKLLNLDDALITEGKIPCKDIKSGKSIHVAMASKTAPSDIIDLNQIRLLIESIGWD